MPDRYHVYISDTLTSPGERYKRLKCINFRRQGRGLGAASFALANAEGPITDGREEYEKENEILLGQFIRVLDTNIGDFPTGCVFLGFIDDLNRDMYVGAKDFRGLITALEIGHYYAQIPILDVHRDENNKILHSPPDFNSLINGIYYANKKEGTTQFKTNSVSLSVPDNWGYLPVENIWTRKNVIDTLIVGAPALGISGERPEDYDENLFLNENDVPNSYPSFYGESYISMLDSMIPEPLSYYFNYWDTLGAIDVKVYSKAKTAVGRMPQAEAYDINLNEIKGVTNFNLLSTQQPVDKVIVQGNNIVVGATHTCNPRFNGNTLFPKWTQEQLDEFIQGNYNDTFDNSELSFESTQAFRSNYPDVYTRFKFYNDSDINAKILYQDDPKLVLNTIKERKPFFPLFKFEDDEGNILNVPTFTDNISESSLNHSTPAPGAINFTDFFPYYDRLSIYIPGGDSIDQDTDRIFKPQVWAFCKTETNTQAASLGQQYSWQNLLSPQSPLKGQLVFHPDGLEFITALQEMVAWEDPSETLFKNDEATKIKYSSDTVTNPETGATLKVYGEWDDSNTSYPRGINPLSDDYGVKTHWTTYLFSVGMESDQRLEISKTRQKLINSGGNVGYIDVNPQVIRTFETNFDLWLARKGSCLDYANSYSASGWTKLFTLSKDTITKNDVPKAKFLLDQIWNWLSIVRSTASLEFQMNEFDIENHSEGWFQIGRYIERIKDYSVENQGQNQIDSEWLCNSTVESIEHIFIDDQERIIVSIETPQEPIFTRIIGGE